MNEVQEVAKSAVKINKKGVRLSWWLIVLAVVVFGGIFVFVKFGSNSNTNSAATTRPDTTEEIKIKQYMSSLRGDIVRYHEDKKTYVGWVPNQGALDQVKKMGSELKTQALTKDAYIIFAKMPTSKTVFCMDSSNFTAEVKSLPNSAKACQ